MYLFSLGNMGHEPMLELMCCFRKETEELSQTEITKDEAVGQLKLKVKFPNKDNMYLWCLRNSDVKLLIYLPVYVTFWPSYRRSGKDHMSH